MIARTTDERVGLLASTFSQHIVASASQARRLLSQALESGSGDVVWATLAVVTGVFPTSTEVARARRAIQSAGADDWLHRMLRRSLRGNHRPTVRVVTRQTIIDVHHTSRTPLSTGIQRVARNVLQNWLGERLLTGWDAELTRMRDLSDEEQHNAVWGGRSLPGSSRGPTVVPWRCHYVLPELAVEPPRTERLAAMAQWSGNRTSVIGFDCVPLTSPETTGAGMGAAFARNLVAVALFDRVITISDAAKLEYDGWRQMLLGAGLRGPEVLALELPYEPPAQEPDPSDASGAAAELLEETRPVLLCVGSHEPRKNHAAVLYAAEVLWQQGCEFVLAFVGGNSWNSGPVMTEIARLRRTGRPILDLVAISDSVLAAAYRQATAVVFPSLNEGFGLPVAEALAAGTPVVTSQFGSMREIGRGRGALLVDPRDDDELVRAVELAMFDQPTRERLIHETRTLPTRTWSEYTAELMAAMGVVVPPIQGVTLTD